MKRPFRFACLALALAIGLPLASAGVSTASSEAVPVQETSLSPTSATACVGWAQGTRVKKASESRIYVIGPDYYLYYIPSPTDYFNLWATWDGILTVPDSQFDACYNSGSIELSNARLVKASTSAAVYIWIGERGWYRQISDWSTFTNKYHFDPARIRTVPASSITPIRNDPWD
ncbi:hypothetical protein G5C60_14210 [Streptomyces sp. HC44]|uniref:Uncharacterized protein n=1 Tax=Streptomyces scabichelini TaxID=2711217 RepID=A0A6G4V3X3_9ACTN|nr:hypothetical protein [Streptomyces scabichelini]NGO08729.1 hypothetical protein [Streptomyces scabichelini]